MPALPLDLSDAEYAVAITLPPAELRRSVMQAVNRYVTPIDPTETGEENDSPTPGDLDAIGRGLEDEAAGRNMDGDILHEQLRTMLRERGQNSQNPPQFTAFSVRTRTGEHRPLCLAYNRT